MAIRTALLASAGALLAFVFQSDTAQAQSLVPLIGQVTSAEEGAMEGVVVSVKKAESTVTISVVSNAEGRVSFPMAKLEPGQYTLRIRAIGYELDGPKTVQVGGPSAAPLAIKLRKARNLAPQLTNAEWMMSIPGTREQKIFMDRCLSLIHI